MQANSNIGNAVWAKLPATSRVCKTNQGVRWTQYKLGTNVLIVGSHAGNAVQAELEPCYLLPGKQPNACATVAVHPYDTCFTMLQLWVARLHIQDQHLQHTRRQCRGHMGAVAAWWPCS
jgi:hypothetical protein